MRFILLLLSFMVLSVPMNTYAEPEDEKKNPILQAGQQTGNAMGDWAKSNMEMLRAVLSRGILPAIGWVFASIFLVISLLKLKEASRDPRGSYAPPIAFFIAALILANIETSLTITTGMNTNDSNNSACSNLSTYLSTHSSGRADAGMTSCFKPVDENKIKELQDKNTFIANSGFDVEKLMGIVYLIQIIGFIYFIYGVSLIPKLSSPGAQITPIKPILHILFSSILINIVAYF